MTEQTRAAIYVRVSTDEQERTGYSFEEQERLGRERAEAEGWSVVEAYSDVMSGRKNDRPSYLRLLDDAAAGRFDVVIVWRADRFGRDMLERLTAEAALKRAGVRLVSLTEPEIDQTDATAPLLQAIRAGYAEMESRLIGQRVSAGLAARAATGRYHGAKAPFGYRFSGIGRGRELVVDVEAAQVVRRIFDRYLSGEGYDRIAYELNADSIPSARHCTWVSTQIRNVLGSPIYVGRVRHKGEVYKGRHKAIVSLETWEQVQELRRARRTGHGRNPAGSHLLTMGVLRCGICGGAMSPRSYANGAQIYRCLNRASYRGGERCSMPPVPRQVIDEQLLDYFTKAVLDIDATREQLGAGHARRLVEARELAAKADAELAKAEAAVERVESAFLAGHIEGERYNHLRDRAESEHAAAAAESARHRERVHEVEADTAHVDAEEELLQRLTDLRAAVVGRVRDAEGIAALRAALTTVFERIDLHVVDGKQYLLPYVRAEALASTDPDALVQAVRVPLNWVPNTLFFSPGTVVSS